MLLHESSACSTFETLRPKADGALGILHSPGITTVLAEVSGGNSQRKARDCLLLQKKTLQGESFWSANDFGEFTPLTPGYSPKGRGEKSHLLRKIPRDRSSQAYKGK